MTEKIELRLTSIDPPTPEPKRTIYRDITNLPDPVKLGLTIRFFNYDDVDLYFQITGSGTGYTFGTVNLGLLSHGTDAYNNLDEFASRTKPSSGNLPNGEMEETITLTLKAYTDSGYSNLKWTYERTVTIHWINSADTAFTVDVLNNFDDGTVQGWAVLAELRSALCGITTEYCLSSPYSILCWDGTSGAPAEGRYRLYKSFTTPNKSKVYAVFDLRPRTTNQYAYLKYLEIKRDDTTLVHIGKAFDTTSSHYIPNEKWIRVVVPLPPNTTLELRVILDYYSGTSPNAPMYMDDFKLISK